MNYEEARNRFIQTWGNLSTQWGINRTMSQIHALLLLSPEALSTDQVMGELAISRGNANMNIRALVDWGLVQKVYVKGDRKEFFVAIKDAYTIARRIARERQKRELKPVVAMLEELSTLKGTTPREKELQKVTEEMLALTSQANEILSRFGDSQPSWWQKQLLKLLR